jgi:hypothetical protein
MFNLNRRHTEALEKTARAKKRLASAEETIAHNIEAFLSGGNEKSEVTPPLLPPKLKIPAKAKPSRK